MPPFVLVTSATALRAPLFKRTDSTSASPDGAAVVVQLEHRCALNALAPQAGATVTALQLVETAYAETRAEWAKAVLEAEAGADAAMERFNVVLESFDTEEEGTEADAAFVRLALPANGACELKLPPKVAPFGVLSMAGVAAQLATAKKVLVMCGAGISVAAGIPDFRTPGIGLYSNLGKYKDLPEPEDLFTLELLEENPALFFQVSNEMNLWPGVFAPTHTHHFVKLLADRGQLRRCYTQNIDGLERAAGLDPDLLVEAHGSFAGATCLGKKCRTPMPLDDVRRISAAGDVPRCPKCDAVVKPDVVFFGEQLPDRFHELLRGDVEAADMLLVIGTSLVVFPFAAIADMVRKGTPRVLLNMQRAGSFQLLEGADDTLAQRDLFLPGCCQAAVQQLATALGDGDKLQEAYDAGKRAVEGKKASATVAGEAK